ncbi:amino acid/polyamine transporter I [Lentinula raphanica]|uniref:Amino acid/polyamine transporter I n=1 Tax=Lentinula raphanica TaxID=153919 RepID=A0AA38PIM7_9AGAR|nr:amino acid/polyamine transporter I [Lentinula raphanica]
MSSGLAVQMQDESLLAQLGYKQEFKRDFGVLELTGLVFSIQGVLPGIASVLVYSIPYGGAVSMVWGWGVCSIFLMFIATAIAELGSAVPTSGGVYYWIFQFSSPSCRKYLSWLLGYIDTIAYIAGVTGINWGCAVQIVAAASIGTSESFQANVFQTYAVFVAVAVLQTVLCSFATRVIAKLQLVYMLINIGLCVGVIFGMPADTPVEFKNDARYAFGSFQNSSLWPDGFAFILSFLAPLWVVGGFDSSVHVSEEARNASTAIPWAIILSTAISCILGWAINVSIAFNMGEDIDGILSNPIGQPLATIFFNSFNQRGTLALWSIIIIAQFMAGTSFLVSSSRQVFAFSALPFSNTLYYVQGSSSVPLRCVWASASVSILLGLIPLAGNAASGAVFALAVVGQYICCSTAIMARWLGGREFKKGPFHMGVLSLPISFCAVLFMMLMSVILLFPAEPNLSGPATMNYTVLVIGSVIVFSTVYYFLPVYGGMNWFTGPVITAGRDDAITDSKSA